MSDANAACGSITYNGHDFSRYCTAMTTMRAAAGVVCDTCEVPGRAGEAVLGGRVPPLPIRVRLFLALDGRKSDAACAAARREMAGWLTALRGAELELPEEPGYVWRDVALTDAGDWESLFEFGECELGFTAYDPVAYGKAVAVTSAQMTGADAGATSGDVTVGGTWPTWPRFRITTDQSAYVQMGLAGGPNIRIDRTSTAVSEVVIDCEAGTVTFDGRDMAASVDMTCDFFRFEPGTVTLEWFGAGEFTVEFTERWL